VRTFRSLVILKRPHEAIWATMRDHLPEIAGRIPEIESVVETARTIGHEDKTSIVNVWRVRYPVPTSVRSLIGIGEFGWIDRNSWDERTRICTWTIEPFSLAEHISCEGRTIFEPAMAGQGTRITLQGTLDVKAGFLGHIAAGAERLLAGFVESAVTTVIPKNLRAVLEAAASFRPKDAESAE
jgi:hypothetical protein